MTLHHSFDHRNIVQSRERIIASACELLADDLRSIEPLHYAQLFQNNDEEAMFKHIDALVEKHFPGGKVMFSYTGECRVDWLQIPVAAIDLELVANNVFAFFRLFFANGEALVELHHISFTDMCSDPEENSRLLQEELFQISA